MPARRRRPKEYSYAVTLAHVVAVGAEDRLRRAYELILLNDTGTGREVESRISVPDSDGEEGRDKGESRVAGERIAGDVTLEGLNEPRRRAPR